MKNFSVYENNTNKETKQDETFGLDTTCGIGRFQPKWLQIFASKKAFVVVYALAGMQHYILGTYFIGTLSTIEKNYNMSSMMSGIVTGSWELGSLITNVFITYIAAKGHRTRWVAAGLFLGGVSSYMRIIPYLLYGPGETIKMYTKEYSSHGINHASGNTLTMNNTFLEKMSIDVNCGVNTGSADIFAISIFIAASIVVGIGTSVYWTCGAAYLDDNVRKNIVPILLATVQVIRLVGPTVGFLMSSYALKIFVDPKLTPTITNTDPRWIGAWWMGWYPIGAMCWICAALLLLFPRVLPRAAMRNKRNNVIDESKNLSWKDFEASIRRIMKNRIVVYNSLSSITFAVGVMAYYTFMPKYMESQFRLTASQSSFLTGTVGILSNALGILTAGVVISKFKPSPRLLAGWNVFVEFLDCIGHASYSWLSCPAQPFDVHLNDDNFSWNLTMSCNEKYKCGNDIQYAPVCDTKTGLAYYSYCHAGCQTSSEVNNTLVSLGDMYLNCSCVPEFGSVVDGLCPIDCRKNVFFFVLISAITSFTTASGRSANALIQFRCVDDRDKSLSIGVTEALLTLFAYMPVPVVYGMIMDWACTVWGNNCGTRGNCWIYDSTRLHIFNLTASGFLLIGTIFDSFVWYHVKGLKIYDEDFEEAEHFMLKNKPYPLKNHISESKTELTLILTSDNVENR